jgi:hypothetical protein
VYLERLADSEREFLCHGLEDEFRAHKVPGRTRIPGGEYVVSMRTIGGFHANYSERYPEIHQGMIWVRNVPGFTYILWHIGNTDNDTAGCLLLGRARGMRLVYSSKTYQRVYEKVAPMITSGAVQRVAYVDND